MQRIAVCALGLFLGIALSGCGGDTKQPIEGTVTLDGTAVKDAAIKFVRTEGEPVTEGGSVTDGKFQTRVPPGKYRIELTGKKVVRKEKRINPMTGKEEEYEVTDELFPEQFNTKSKLIEEIKPGQKTITLDLKSTK